jgi:hypothetical protein
MPQVYQVETGKSYNSWTVISPARKFSFCECICGKKKSVRNRNLVLELSMGCRSCACRAAAFKRHGNKPKVKKVKKVTKIIYKSKYQLPGETFEKMVARQLEEFNKPATEEDLRRWKEKELEIRRKGKNWQES